MSLDSRHRPPIHSVQQSKRNWRLPIEHQGPCYRHLQNSWYNLRNSYCQCYHNCSDRSKHWHSYQKVLERTARHKWLKKWERKAFSVLISVTRDGEKTMPPSKPLGLDQLALMGFLTGRIWVTGKVSGIYISEARLNSQWESFRSSIDCEDSLIPLTEAKWA